MLRSSSQLFCSLVDTGRPGSSSGCEVRILSPTIVSSDTQEPIASLWPLRAEYDATNSRTLRCRNKRDNPNDIRQRIGSKSATITCFRQSLKGRQAGAGDTSEWKREGFRCSLTRGGWQGEAGGVGMGGC